MPRSASHPGSRGVRLSMRVASEEDGRHLSPRSHLRPLGDRNTTLLKATIRHIQGPQNEENVPELMSLDEMEENIVVKWEEQEEHW